MPLRTDPIRSTQHRDLLNEAARAALALQGRSAEIEAQRHLPQEIADALAGAGLYRMLTPQVHGGHEVHPATFYAVVEQLARADAAAAWCCFISCTASVLAAYLPEAEAAAIFGRPDLKTAGVFAPRGRAVAAEQEGVAGLRVTGRWAWGSGARNADIVTAGCLLIGDDGKPALLADGSPRVLSVVLERSQVRLLDNWNSLGLCGTGSGEFEVSDAFVPLARSASLFDGPRIDTPLYRFPVFGLLAIAIAAVATGIAREALDHFVTEAGRSVPQASTKPLAARPVVQDAVARAEARLQSARAWLMATIDAAWAAAQLSGPLTVEHRRDLRLAATHAVQSSAEVVDRVYTLAGGAAVFAASPLQRALRNVRVATQHMMVGDATYELTGRLLLGVPTNVAML
ncbi:MAG: acyl-CoA dehydrogenase family protein [Burkholderiaceae bacterium]|nr:acyl-CoA dehydrogenase family protein [Burkholderiaceae bacterium]